MIDDGTLSIDWDSNENQAAVNERGRVLLLTKRFGKCKAGCTRQYQRTATHEREIQNFLQHL
jgi:hypothetical protein